MSKIYNQIESLEGNNQNFLPNLNEEEQDNFIHFYSRLDYEILSQNPSAIPFFERHPNKIPLNHVKKNWYAYNNLSKLILNEKINEPLKEEIPFIKALNNFEDTITIELTLKNTIENLLNGKHEFIRLFDGIKTDIVIKNKKVDINLINKLNELINLYNTEPKEFEGDIFILEPHKINWKNVILKKSDYPLLEKNLNKINWSRFSMNNSAFDFLEKHLDKIDWKLLSLNPSAIDLLDKYPNKIDWNNLSRNNNGYELWKKYPTLLNWDVLSRNSNATDFLEENMGKINWKELCKNTNEYLWKDYEIILK